MNYTVYRCSDCGQILDADTRKCPVCGSKLQTVIVGISDSVDVKDQLKAKAKEIEKKKPIKEIVTGSEKCISKGKFVDKTRVIDRENDYYFEKVVDPDNGEIIRLSEEPLSKHFGHGSAKSSNNSSKK